MNCKFLTLMAVVFALCLSRSIAAEPVEPTTPVMVFGEKIIAAQSDRIWRVICDRFAQENKLVASDAECEAFEKFQDAVMRKAREKRKRELADIELQLKSAGIPEAKKQELQTNRDMYLSLENTAAGMEKLPGIKEVQRKNSRPWITLYKVDKALYEKYGGAVAITKTGLFPFEARRKLIEEHIHRGDIVFADKTFEAKFWESYETLNKRLAEKEKIDFTPYWLKPLPD